MLTETTVLLIFSQFGIFYESYSLICMYYCHLNFTVYLQRVQYTNAPKIRGCLVAWNFFSPYQPHHVLFLIYVLACSVLFYFFLTQSAKCLTEICIKHCSADSADKYSISSTLVEYAGRTDTEVDGHSFSVHICNAFEGIRH